ncbi:Predicted acetyltransferase [Dermatophilus congolensis]|uniref:Predicted acetyltransferase n=1 Tax=Dermatophilus congolensis TaxID=1863 RepID=A0AA46BL33_9MICO|nr:GNAT family N-acetyltransferase [Dermatophilus congolensis]STD02817.1 Predicted acetyltransferase [Dermatophilus congolensis]
MTDISIRILGEDDWQVYREGRLRALKESPEGFAAKYEDEAAVDDQLWKDRVKRSSRLVAEQDGRPVGIASVRLSDDLFENASEVFGLWVAADLRGTGLASRLVQEAAQVATAHERGQLLYWVGTENARGVAFASSFGFRPTEYRRPMRVHSAGEEASQEASSEEIALSLALER